MKVFHPILATIGYLKARLSERSTWAAITGGLTGAALLPDPWNVVAAIAGIIGALVPEKGEPDDDEGGCP